MPGAFRACCRPVITTEEAAGASRDSNSELSLLVGGTAETEQVYVNPKALFVPLGHSGSKRHKGWASAGERTMTLHPGAPPGPPTVPCTLQKDTHTHTVARLERAILIGRLV